MRFLISFFILFLTFLNANICNWPSPYDNSIFKIHNTTSSGESYLTSYNPSIPQHKECSPYTSFTLTDYTFSHTTLDYQNKTVYWFKWNSVQWYVTSACPAGTAPDSNNMCMPFSPCSWAVSPWKAIQLSGINSVSCSTTTINGLYADHIPMYTSAAAWCNSDHTCYVTGASCPSGQFYDKTMRKCIYPHPDESKCSSGYISRNYSTGIDGITKSCFTEYICKSNPSIKETVQVSCGTKKEDFNPITGASGSITPEKAPDSTRKPDLHSDRTSECNVKAAVAKSNCQSPNVLSFYCDPMTGIEVAKCTPPTTPEKTTINSGDSEKTATVESIKELSNELPTRIRDAIKDFFTDGSESHLSSIQSSLKQTNSLTADVSDKIHSLNETAGSQLVAQHDTNAKLDESNAHLSSINNALNGGGTYTGAANPTESELSNDSNGFGDFDVFKNSITQVQTQFENAKSVFNGGFTPPSFGSGHCEVKTFSAFKGQTFTVNPEVMISFISPYSSIISIMIYIASIIGAFRMIFKFLSRGV